MNWFVRFVDFVICFLRSFRLMNDELFPVLWFDYVPQNISNPFENVTLVSISNLRIRKRYTCNIFEKNILLIQLLYSGTYSGTLLVPQNLSNPFENVTLVSVSNLRIRKWYTCNIFENINIDKILLYSGTGTYRQLFIWRNLVKKKRYRCTI